MTPIFLIIIRWRLNIVEIRKDPYSLVMDSEEFEIILKKL